MKKIFIGKELRTLQNKLITEKESEGLVRRPEIHVNPNLYPRPTIIKPQDQKSSEKLVIEKTSEKITEEKTSEVQPTQPEFDISQLFQGIIGIKRPQIEVPQILKGTVYLDSANNNERLL